MDTKFWKNKKVLITGYEGFLGSHLTRSLVDAKANICGLDILVRRKRTLLRDNELDKVNIIKGSVENFSLVSKIIKENKIEIIFHLAAKSLVGQGLQKPVKTFSTNIKGTWNILEASRNSNSVTAIIVASSDKAYGSHRKLPYLEDCPLRGRYPYDVSKSCADLIAQSYYATYGLAVCVVRCGNIYGPGDFNFSRIVPEAIKSALNKKMLKIRSNGRFTRDYVYIDDVINGYLLLAETMKRKNLSGEAFNLSNEKPCSVFAIVKLIYGVLGEKPNYKIMNVARTEIVNQYLSASKARKALGWKPRRVLQDGLKDTVAWYMAHIKDIT